MFFSEAEAFVDFLRINSDKKIYVWGCGASGELVGQVLNQNGILWNGYYDNFIAPGTVLNEKIVFGPADFSNDEAAIIIISPLHYHGIKQQLNSYGVSDNRMIWMENPDFLNSLVNMMGFKSQRIHTVQEFRDIFHGESCFVVGSGPSLRLTDLEKIGEKGFRSFVCNFFHQCYDKTDFRPNYHVTIDKVLLRQVAEDRNALAQILSSCEYMFVRQDSAMFNLRDEPEMDNMIYLKCAYPKTLDRLEFSSDCSKYVCTGINVGFVMLQLAVFMGFQKIYLIGMDHTASRIQNPDGTVEEHSEIVDHAGIFGDYGKFSELWEPTPLYMTTRGYEAAKLYADTHGIEIYNATRGGQLEVFPRVDFDELMK